VWGVTNNWVGNCDVFAVVFMSANTYRLLHQLTRVTVIIWDCRGFLEKSGKLKGMWRHLSQSMARAVGNCWSTFWYNWDHIVHVNFLLVALTAVVGSQMDCFLQRYFQWKILHDRARYILYQYTWDTMARISTIYAGIYVKLLFSIFDLYHS